MNRKMELGLFFVAIMGLLVSRSPIVLADSITLGIFGTALFVLSVMGLFSDDLKGFIDPASQ